MHNVATSKAALEAKNAGLTGVFLTLIAEHRELTERLLQIRMSSDPGMRAKLFPTLREQLVAHETAEGNVLYLAMGKKEQTRLIAVKHRRTSGDLHRLIERLSTLEYAGVNWDPTFRLLFDTFEQHTIEEESYYFPIAQRVLGEAKAQLLYTAYAAALAVSHAQQSNEAH